MLLKTLRNDFYNDLDVHWFSSEEWKPTWLIFESMLETHRFSFKIKEPQPQL